MHVCLQHFTTGGRHSWSLLIERVESVTYFLKILATLSPVPRTYPKQELTGLPRPALWTVFCEYKYWQGQFGSILHVFIIFILSCINKSIILIPID